MDTFSGPQHVNMSKTRAAVRATSSQLIELNKVFRETTRPTKGVKDSLAERTRLSPDWINSWFMRQRKKQRSIRYRPEVSPQAAMEHPPGILQPSPLNGSQYITFGGTHATAAATISASNGPGNTWPGHCPSDSGAPVSTCSINTARPVVSLPDANRNHMHMHDAAANNTPVWHAFLLSHATTATSQSTVSSASSTSFENLSDSSRHSHQFSAYVPQFRQSMLSNAPLVNPNVRQPHSFYASASSSGPSAADTQGRSVLLECQLESQLEIRLLSDANPRRASSTLKPLHTGELSTNVGDRKDSSVEKHGASPHFGPNSPASSFPTEDLSMVHRAESVATETGTDTLQIEASEYLTPTTETAASPVYQGDTESNLGNDVESDMGRPMSEAEAWKKARAHPDFETFLKIAGVRGNFELTDNGLVFRNGATSPSHPTS